LYTEIVAQDSSMKKTAVGLYAALTVALMAWGFYQAIYVAPDEATMHEVQRIFYYHVPSAMVAFLFFAISMAGSIGYLAFRRNQPDRAQAADAWALAGAEVGVVFCSVVLITGPIWGHRAWGIWWTWDPRLTSMLLLWLLYVSYLMLRKLSSTGQTHTLAAVLSVFAAIDVPIVYMSIQWWRTQHPAPVFFSSDPNAGVDKSMYPAWFWNLGAWAMWGIFLVAFRYALERRRQASEQDAALQAIEATLEMAK
jgi:heme exporter protein C